MTDESDKQWVLPPSIPFADLKRRDLEECIYWLSDAMGAKDLEWQQVEAATVRLMAVAI